MLSAYLPQLTGKKIALVINQTAHVGKTHLLDTLLSLGINISKVFAPEHGFRGDQDAGKHISSQVDPQTGIPIISLYGKQKKPSRDMLLGIEAIVFDIQDVGVRFYTYLSTLHYVMEAAAENEIPILVLDRPNPNGDYIDGPVLDLKYKSFVGLHPVPIVYGMTVGEYALMINGEGWLRGGRQAVLSVIRCRGYQRDMDYALPVKPSPNLPNTQSIPLYPSLCLFEGTNVSVGRGTPFPFQVFGSPYLKGDFKFTPKPTPGARRPKYRDKACHGTDLRTVTPQQRIQLRWLLSAYQANTKRPFFNAFFTKLAGNKDLQKQIERGASAADIRKSWESDLSRFKKVRERYLLYR